MPNPLLLKNYKLWTDTPSGHKEKTLTVYRAPSPAPSIDDEGKGDDDDQ